MRKNCALSYGGEDRWKDVFSVCYFFAHAVPPTWNTITQLHQFLLPIIHILETLSSDRCLQNSFSGIPAWIKKLPQLSRISCHVLIRNNVSVSSKQLCWTAWRQEGRLQVCSLSLQQHSVCHITCAWDKWMDDNKHEDSLMNLYKPRRLIFGAVIPQIGTLPQLVSTMEQGANLY